jgi:hypothetical protein
MERTGGKSPKYLPVAVLLCSCVVTLWQWRVAVRMAGERAEFGHNLLDKISIPN